MKSVVRGDGRPLLIFSFVQSFGRYQYGFCYVYICMYMQILKVQKVILLRHLKSVSQFAYDVAVSADNTLTGNVLLEIKRKIT